jgi:predicted GNAT superfamily acetyltransferase
MRMSLDPEIRAVREPSEIIACHAVMLQLRPHQSDQDAFLQQVLRQFQQGYLLSAAWTGRKVVGAVGYRVQENQLHWRFVYVDDLVVDENSRGDRMGAKLLSVARDHALQSGCRNFVLDTGLHKSLAQRFYFREGLLAHAMGFVARLDETTEGR